MTFVLWLGALLFIGLVLRLVHPGAVHYVKEFLVRAKVNRILLDPSASMDWNSSPQFGVLLSLAFRHEGATVVPRAMQLRCLKLTELLAVLTTGDYERRGHPQVGMGLVELADMISILGSRFKPAAEERETVVAAHEILTLLVDRASPNQPGDIEQRLAKTALSVVQIGELLVAAVYALTARETADTQGG
jgi:hypothetical protein